MFWNICATGKMLFQSCAHWHRKKISPSFTLAITSIEQGFFDTVIPRAVAQAGRAFFGQGSLPCGDKIGKGILSDGPITRQP